MLWIHAVDENGNVVLQAIVARPDVQIVAKLSPYMVGIEAYGGASTTGMEHWPCLYIRYE